MNQKELLHSGELYWPNDEELMREQMLCMEKLYDFNATRPLEFYFLKGKQDTIFL